MLQKDMIDHLDGRVRALEQMVLLSLKVLTPESRETVRQYLSDLSLPDEFNPGVRVGFKEEIDAFLKVFD